MFATTKFQKIMFVTLFACFVALSAAAQAPANDDFAQPLMISCGSGIVQSSNRNATAERVEPSHRGQAPVHSVWFKWKARCNGRTEFSIARSGTVAVVAAYTGTALGNLQPVLNLGNEAELQKITFEATQDEFYYLAVDGPSNAWGGFLLQWRWLGSNADLTTRVVTIAGKVQRPFGQQIPQNEFNMACIDQSGQSFCPSCTTASGKYTFSNLPGGRSYSVVPSSPLYTFSPTSNYYASVNQNQLGENYTAFVSFNAAKSQGQATKKAAPVRRKLVRPTPR